MKKIFVLLRSQTGHDFSQYKPSTVNRRVERRLAVHQIDSLDRYVRFLQQTPVEVDALFRDLLIGVTNFFRDPEAFKSLEEQVIPKLFANKPVGSAIRVWVAGCSTGEEAYSIAILLQEHLEQLKQGFKVQVFATDIDPQSIAIARGGIYPASITADISAERLAHYFSADADGSVYRIHKVIRDLLVFSEQDVIKDPPFSKLDLLSCRNLLIYMGSDLQKKLIPLFHYALNPGGILFLGTSETVGEFTTLFTSLDRKSKLYQRNEDLHFAQRVALGRFLIPISEHEAATPRTASKPTSSNRLPLRDLTEQALLQQIAPAGALVDGQGDIYYLHGRTGMYLEPAQGEAGINNILKMAREGLRRELTMALHQAVRAQEMLRFPNLRVKTNGSFTLTNLTIRPVKAFSSDVPQVPLYLVVLEEAPLQTLGMAEKPPESVEQTSDSDAHITALKQELRAKEEYLQTANEELETSNEELKSSNEEMQSVNEELQSTNEELETSKEELQSVNEELATINTELQTKVMDLARANNDMTNLLAGTGIGTIFVDNYQRILRFTPATTSIINFITSDVGRPVGHIVTNLTGYDNIVSDVQSVLDTLIPKEVTLQTILGKWYTMRIQPYRTLENVIEGAVITFMDITEIKHAGDAVQKSEERFRQLFIEAPLGIALVDSLTRQIYEANPMFARIAGRTMEEMMKTDWINITHPDDVQQDIDNMALLNAGTINGYQMEKRYLHHDGIVVWINMTVTRVAVEDNAHPRHLCMIEDITERKRAEQALLEANKMLRLAVVVRDAHDAITVQSLDGSITAWNPGAARIFGWSEAEALAMNVRDMIPPEIRDKELARIQQLSLAEILEPYRTQRIAKDGRVVEVWLTATALVNPDKKMYAIATTERETV